MTEVDKTKLIVAGNIDALEQARDIIESLTDDDYVRVIRPQFQSSIGQHMRHILDAYAALQNAIEGNASCIDYEKRTRGSGVETNLHDALTVVDDVKSWLCSLSACQLNESYEAVHQVTNAKNGRVFSSTTVERELIFLISHSVHHFALLRSMLSCMSYSISSELGKANSTICYENDSVKA